MNSHDRQHEALDDDERELARIVRALPGGDPPPALDAHILRMAQDAVAAAPTRRRRPLLALGSAWGISSAAAAVLALGVGWQLLNPPGRGLPASDGTSAPTTSMSMQEKKADQRTEVDFIERELPMPPAPPPPMDQDIASLPKSILPSAQPSPTLPQASGFASNDALSPEPFMDEHVDLGHHEGGALAAKTEASTPSRAHSEVLADTAAAQSERRESQAIGRMARDDAPRQQAAAAAMAPAAPPAPALSVASETAAGQDRDAGQSIDSIEVTGSRIAEPVAKARTRAIASSTPADRERVRQQGDAALAREAWVERIRQRIGNGDLSGAHASLVLHLERYPGIDALPRDLRRLLQK